MTTDPTQTNADSATPPSECPACGASVTWISGSKFFPKVRADYECGYVWGNKDVTRKGFEWDEKTDCTRAFTAAVQLRAKVAAADKVIEQSLTTVAELAKDIDGLRQQLEQATRERDALGREVLQLQQAHAAGNFVSYIEGIRRDAYENAKFNLAQEWKSQEQAELTQARAERDALEAERNSYRDDMARYAEQILNDNTEIVSLRAQLAAAPAQGWRLLDAGETIQSGDQWQKAEDQWIPCYDSVGKRLSHFPMAPVRRRVALAAPDAERAEGG